MTDASLSETLVWPSDTDCQDMSWAEWSGSRVRFYGTSSILTMAEGNKRGRETAVLGMEEEPQSGETLL